MSNLHNSLVLNSHTRFVSLGIMGAKRLLSRSRKSTSIAVETFEKKKIVF